MAPLTHSGWRHHVVAAEDDDHTYRRPQTAGAEPDDALDDADDVCLSDPAVSQWPGPVLGDFKCHQYCNAVLCYRLGGTGFDDGEEGGY